MECVTEVHSLLRIIALRSLRLKNLGITTLIKELDALEESMKSLLIEEVLKSKTELAKVPKKDYNDAYQTELENYVH